MAILPAAIHDHYQRIWFNRINRRSQLYFLDNEKNAEDGNGNHEE